MKKIFILLIIGAFISSLFAQQNKENTSAVLTDWMNLHCKIVRSAEGIAHVAYSRHFAYTAIAAYESIVYSNPKYNSLKGQLDGLHSLPEPKEKISWTASINAAYSAMLRNFYSGFGSCTATIDSMEAAQKKKFAAQKTDKKLMDDGEEYGKSIAATIIQWSLEDHSNSSKQYAALNGDGVWTPVTTAAVPFWAESRSLTKDIFSGFNLAPPVYSTEPSSHFYKMVNEVYNTSVTLSPEQKATAVYWDDSPNGKYMTVFGHWTSITSGLIRQHNLSLIKGAEAFAKMAIAMYEAGLLAWKGKYQYHVLRPDAYIQKHINPQWKSLIATPNHPEFPAAHATLSNAAATALCSLFGEDCAVTDNSYVDIGMKERSYTSLQDMAKEAGYSRLYGGIHYRYSIEQGFSLGAVAAKHVDQRVRFQ